MSDHRSLSSPRGKYSRLRCQGCRSRKIKCVLSGLNDIGPLGIPQPPATACERCRNLKLPCVVERTILGRPAAKRAQRKKSPARTSATMTQWDTRADGWIPPPPNLDIEGYIYSAVTDDGSIFAIGCGNNTSKLPSKRDIYLSMIEPANFLSSVLANDQAFGAGITHASSHSMMPITDLISNDLAASLDQSLVWHRFFLPCIPSLASILDRLIADENATTNSASNLLFMLLCLIAFELPDSPFKPEPQLIQNIQLAVSTYGQEFIFSPPTHQDSVVVSLLLSDYKPTVVVSSQTVSHRAIRSELYVNLAYRITERLELLPAQTFIDPTELQVMSPDDLEYCLSDSLLGLQVYCYDASLETFVAKPLHTMWRVLECMEPHIEVYRNILQRCQCKPRTIYSIQNMIASYIVLRSVADMKKSWNSLDVLSKVLEGVEKECLEQMKLSHSLLAHSTVPNRQDESSAASYLLEMRFRSVYIAACALGIGYASILKGRFESGKAEKDYEIYSHEAVRIGDHVIDSLKNMPDNRTLDISPFLNQFAVSYPYRLEEILEKFIETEHLKINGVSFYPPRHLILEVVSHCKNLVENNIILMKTYGRIHQHFDDRLELFAKCAERLEAMEASSKGSIDNAFAGGCVYAASSKLVYGLRDLMQTLKSRFLKGEIGAQQLGMLEANSDADVLNELGLVLPLEGWDLWPQTGGFDLSQNLQDLPDWSPRLDFSLGSEPTNVSRQD